jgi:hypothetical protein
MAEHLSLYVLTMDAITSFQFMAWAGVNANIHQTRHWERSLNIYERDNDKTNKQRV